MDPRAPRHLLFASTLLAVTSNPVELGSATGKPFVGPLPAVAQAAERPLAPVRRPAALAAAPNEAVSPAPILEVEGEGLLGVLAAQRQSILAGASDLDGSGVRRFDVTTPDPLARSRGAGGDTASLGIGSLGSAPAAPELELEESERVRAPVRARVVALRGDGVAQSRPVLDAARGQLEYCFSRLDPERAEGGAKVVAGFFVAPTGQVEALVLDEVAPRDASFEACLSRVLSRLRFSPSSQSFEVESRWIFATAADPVR